MGQGNFDGKKKRTQSICKIFIYNHYTSNGVRRYRTLLLYLIMRNR